MAEAGTVATASGIEIGPAAASLAAEVSAAVRAATRDLPFGAEPAAFLAVLEALAAEDDPA